MASYSLTIARVCAIVAAIIAILGLAHVAVAIAPAVAVCILLLALALLLPF